MSLGPRILAWALVLTMQAGLYGISSAESKSPFDISRFTNEIEGWFVPFYVTETKPLRAALAARNVLENTALLVTETAGGRLALLTEQMAYHHIAQGVVNGKTWMATF